jgi:metallophosphoesterase (TIGR00282 family)
LNYPPGTPGQGSGIFQIKVGSSRCDDRTAQRAVPANLSIAVLNLQGRTFMPVLENPFLIGREEVERLREQTKIIFVDFHAEATSEKIAFARMLDGQVSAVVGTHTHVQTADEQIFPGGTAYLTDAGFTGPHESVLGREIEPVIKRFLTNQPQRFEVAKNRVLLHGVVVEIDEASGKTINIQRVSTPLKN